VLESYTGKGKWLIKLKITIEDLMVMILILVIVHSEIPMRLFVKWMDDLKL